MIWSQPDFCFFVGKPFLPSLAWIPIGFRFFFSLWYEKKKITFIRVGVCVCVGLLINDAFYEILSDWNINLSLTQAVFLLLPFLVSPQFAIFSFRLYFIPTWDLLDGFPVSLFFFNCPHPSAFPWTAGHFRTCPSLLWYQCPPFVCSLLLVFFIVKQSFLYKSAWCC